MKTAKIPPAEPSSSSRRSQPVRQTRTNPPRTNSGLNRLAGRDLLSGANAAEQPIDIFPGVTHFADAINALPKELVRHFTLLKEVDAKIFAPEEALFQMIDAALETPPPDTARSLNGDALSNAAPTSAPMSAQNSSSGIVANGHVIPQSSADGSIAPSVFDPSNLPRRQLFRQTALKISEMLVSLEEKNHVISTANEALQKQLERVDDIWPHLAGEFSEEAKWGSDTHWAYPENRAARALNNQAERTRREGAANLSAAAQMLAEEAAARSDARKQAVAAKKSQRNQQHEPEHDDHDNKGKEGSNKKSHSNTKRKTAAASTATDSPASVGLGITGQAGTGTTPAPKRRKVEKPTNNGPPAERAMNTVVSNAKESKTKASASPQSTPVPDQPAPKKRKALPNSNGQAKKRNGPGASPSVASSPVIATFPDSLKVPRASPAPSLPARPASSRVRQSSIASNVDNARQNPPSAASNKPNGSVPAPLEIPTPNTHGPNSEASSKSLMEPPPSATVKTDPSRQQSERAPTPSSTTVSGGQKKEGSAKPVEEETRKESTPSVTTTPTTQQVTTTKSGRASKPSTPAIGSFPDNPPKNNGNSRSRPSRNSEAPTVPKRSHKKGASAAHTAAVQKALVQQKADEDTSSMQEEEIDIDDPNEPRYCYCNRVSFGEMVGCDGEACKIEWFHLECVGLRSAPKNLKWYCDDCKRQLTTSGKKVNGR